jgi:hypothetical protein
MAWVGLLAASGCGLVYSYDGYEGATSGSGGAAGHGTGATGGSHAGGGGQGGTQVGGGGSGNTGNTGNTGGSGGTGNTGGSGGAGTGYWNCTSGCAPPAAAHDLCCNGANDCANCPQDAQAACLGENGLECVLGTPQHDHFSGQGFDTQDTHCGGTHGWVCTKWVCTCE